MFSKKQINPVVLTLMFSDTLIFTGFGLIEPFLSIFIQDIDGGSITSAGIASGIFLITKSVLQLPLSRYIDKHDHDFFSPHNHRSTAILWGGLASVAIVPFLYYFSTNILHIFTLQFLYGIGAAMSFPTWLKLWELHIDSGKESFEWTLYSTVVSLSVAVAAIVGGALIDRIGFRPVFLMTGLITAVGAGVLVTLKNDARRMRFPVMNASPK